MLLVWLYTLQLAIGNTHTLKLAIGNNMQAAAQACMCLLHGPLAVVA